MRKTAFALILIFILSLALPGLALAAVVPAGWAVWDVFAQPPQPLEPEQLLEPVPVVDWAAVAAQSV